MRYIIYFIAGLCLAPLSIQAGYAHWNIPAVFDWAAKEHATDGKLLKAICYVESNHNPNAKVVWDNGPPAYGICQLKLATARHMGFKGNPQLLMNPTVNIFYAAKYLAYQLDRYDNDWRKAATAYNRGSYKPGIRLNNGYVIKVKFAMRKI